MCGQTAHSIALSMKRSSSGDRAEAPANPRAPKLPRLRVAVRPRCGQSGQARAGTESSETGPSGSSASHSVAFSEGDSDRLHKASENKCVKAASEDQRTTYIQPRIVKRGLKRAGPYLLGKHRLIL